MNIGDIKRIILDKVRYIFIAGFVCAILVAGFKYCFTPSVSYEGNYIYTRIIRIENSTDVSNPNFEFNYMGILNTDGCYVAFIKSAEQAYDLSKINSSWNWLSQQDKIKWLRKFTRYNNYHNETYEIIFNLPANNIGNLSYLNKNFSGLMDMFVKQGNLLIAKIKPDAVIQTVSETVLLPKKKISNKKAIALKYSVYGFIAGIFLTMAALIGVSLFKEIQD